jgi:predicted DCC family thiol-disulfide oxidoreductase YuxK
MCRLDTRRRIDFIDVSEEGGICPIDRQSLLARLHASENDVLLSGAAAFAAMWRAIPLLRPVGLLAKSPTILRVLEFAYVTFLKARPTLQRFVDGRSAR